MTARSPRCIDPPAVTPDDRLAYARGEASQAAVEHIDRCSGCRAQAAEHARMDSLLDAALQHRSCPSTLEIGEYALGTLAPAAVQTLAAHLVECPRCLEERRGFSAFLVEPEPEPASGGVLVGLRRLLATPLRPPADAHAGLRGGGDADGLTYTAGDVRLTLSVQRAASGAGRTIAGLLEPGAEPFEGSPVLLYAGDQRQRATALDDLGSFLLEGAPPGSYRLELTLGNRIIVIDPLTVS